MLNLGFALLLKLCFNSLALPLLASFRFSTPAFFRFLSLCCKGCVSLGVCSLQSKCLIILNLINQNFPQDIVQHPIVLVSSGFDDSSIPLLMFSTSFTFLYLNCFLHAVIYFVHCALSLIILFYICTCSDTRYFKMFVYSCLSK